MSQPLCIDGLHSFESEQSFVAIIEIRHQKRQGTRYNTDMVTVRTFDESTLGAMVDGPVLELPGSRITIRELITLRVRAEVDRYNREQPERYYGLVQPSDVEEMLNGPRTRSFRKISADAQVKIALDAFERQGFLVLLPAGQASSLDEEVTLYPDDSVSFLRLVPLIGG